MIDATRYEAALKYHERGWRVVPLHNMTDQGACSCGETEEHAEGKHPIKGGWQKPGAALGVADLATYFLDGPANVGIATGRVSGFFVLDVDPKNGGDKKLDALEKMHGPLPDTYTVKTGSGGFHFYYALPAEFEVTNRKGDLPDGLDIRGNGGQVVAPPSVSGVGVYTVSQKGKIAYPPAWLLEAIRPPERRVVDDSSPILRLPDEVSRYAVAVMEAEVQAVMEATEDRNITLNKAAFSLAQIAAHDALDLDAIRDALSVAGEFAGLGVREVRATVESGIRGGLKKPREPWPPPPREESGGEFIPFREEGRLWVTREWDDLGNAERLLDHYGDALRWVASDRAWAVYTEGTWTREKDEVAQGMVHRMLGALPQTEAGSYGTTPDEKGKTQRDAFLAFVKKQRTSAKVTAILKEARAIPAFHATPDQFDRNPHLLAVANGVVDLRDGSLHEHRPENMITQRANVAYDPNARAPRWEAFLEETHELGEVRDFLRRVVGYTLSGDLGEQLLFIHHGSGANGKSVFLSVLGKVLGSYGQVVPRSTLITKTGEAIPTDVARMVGKRFLQTSETAAGRHLDEEVVKSITGGDTQVARHLYGREFEFDPQGTIHYVTNHLPRVSDAASIWRRLVLIGWNRVIPEEDRDHGLAERIAEEEGAGVLAWAVSGAVQWYETRPLKVPLVCLMARDAYREDSDEFGEFLSEEVVSAPGEWTSTLHLYEAYEDWATKRGFRGWSMKAFSLSMKERGYADERRRTEDGRRLRGVSDVKLRRSVPSERLSFTP